MMRTRWLAWGAVLPALVFAVPAAAEESPLAQVPARAPVVIHLRGPERAKDRLLTLAKNALPDEAGRLAKTKLEEALKDALDGREWKGLPPDGPMFLVFLQVPTPEQDRPPAALILRVTRYADFRDGILKGDERKALKRDRAGYEVATVNGKEVYFVGHKHYAVVTLHKDVAVQFTRRQPGLDGKLDKEAAGRFLEADLSVYLDVPAINKEYAEQIKEGRKFLEQALRQATQFHEGDKSAEGMVKGMSGLFLRAVEDSRAALLYVYFRPDGLALHAQTRIGAGTRTGLFLKSFRPSALGDLLAKMPAGHLAYSAMQVEPALLQVFPAWLYGLSAGPGDGQDKVVREALRRLTEAKPRAKLDSAQLPLQGMQVWDYEDPAKAVAARLQLLRALKAGDTFEGVVLKEKPEVKAQDLAYRGLELHYLGTAWDIPKMIAAQTGRGTPEAFEKEAGKRLAELMKKFLGEGRKTWFGTDGKVFVQVVAKDWDSARRQFDQYLDGKDSVGRQFAFRETRSHLPAETTVLMLVDASYHARVMAEFMRAAGDLPAAFPAPPAATGEAGYLGVAVTLQPDRGSLDVWLPAAAAREFYKTFEPLFKLQLELGRLRR
jgi:hypothetical protein